MTYAQDVKWSQWCLFVASQHINTSVISCQLQRQLDAYMASTPFFSRFIVAKMYVILLFCKQINKIKWLTGTPATVMKTLPKKELRKKPSSAKAYDRVPFVLFSLYDAGSKQSPTQRKCHVILLASWDISNLQALSATRPPPIRHESASL